MTPDSRSKMPATAGNPADSSPLARLVLRWLDLSSDRVSRPGAWHRPAERWMLALVDELSRALENASVQILAQNGPRWDLLAKHLGSASATGTTIQPSLPSSILIESMIPSALDATKPVIRDQTIVAAIHRGGEAIDREWTVTLTGQVTPGRGAGETIDISPFPPTVLAVSASGLNASWLDTITSLAQTLQTIDRHQHLLGYAGDVAAHLRRLLDLSVQWTQIDDTDRLLEAIASSSADLLGAERASIFLWDKRRGKLVGRPALGVEGGKLEVDDNAGVVGAVLGSGQSRIWNSSEDSESEVNRSVDKKLKFQTRSLVAVPLTSPSGTLLGVFEVINKKQGKFDAADATRLTDLARHAAAAIQGTETRQRLTSVRDRLLHDAASSSQVIGESPVMRSLRDTVTRVARTDLAVLVLGENGTGKEVLARSTHFQSSRREQPFVAVNCAALVESLLESELFGHERGAFTDAVQARPGKFELATGGTLFLDEIGDMSPGGQAKLLRVLEEKIVVRVGGSTPIPVDVRIIAATNQSLPDLVATKRFREDLFFRLNVVSFRLPPLRERGEDILILANHFIAQFALQIGRVQPTFSGEARQALLRHRWPGNVRELRNVMERTCYLSSGDVITEFDLGLTAWETPSSTSSMTSNVAPPSMATSTTTHALTSTTGALTPLADATRDFQIAHIHHAIDRAKGNMTDAAESLGLHRSNLYRKMKQLDMKTDGEDL
jgi:transcriptional regulator with GAF, ATPase, and Fis domain